ncbi:alpha/beta fold hydrolase [Paracoccus laeviglucosivorans]|uniref:Pimeloyl-ACP methyl ester carboxylesterase n=1 Tax=Paracoccus laeviglucosivorans TaxID=1197861 RepID=A0A521FEP6_9RHOB|nr:alpha/beta hydrolase [Paracoccus laeviglucosivorans]SMO94653.1 Pimeloyl-ACP methyl ester carboxylesterase [Paracoccus laeviglucosivorans]
MGIILVPGFMLDADLWSDVIHDLATFGPIIHADPMGALSIEDMAEKTLAVAPNTFAVVGFSMGGYVAREIQRIAPQRVSKLVLLATSARGDSDLQARRKVAIADADPSAFRGLSRQSIRRSLSPEREEDNALVERIHAMSVRLGGQTFRNQAVFRRDGDLDKLPTIDCPTLIVAGGKDRLRSLEEAAEMQSAIPDAQMKIIEVGHMIPMEAPAELSPLLRAFLSG